jgi:tRNA pseudouridine65 synthase
MTFDILYQDECLIAINKPYGYFVHRTKLDFQAETLVMPNLRDQIGQYVYPVHRLDRKTTGVLLFALDTATQSIVNSYFAEGKVNKKYHAIVRGYTPEEAHIDYELTNDTGTKQNALTNFKTMQHSEIPISSGKHPTSRYSLVELTPITGRQHQLRKHMSHIFHPIIGDRPHGCNKQNRFFLNQFNFSEMLLHAHSLQLTHPNTSEDIYIQAPYFDEFIRMSMLLSFNTSTIDE